MKAKNEYKRDRTRFAEPNNYYERLKLFVDEYLKWILSLPAVIVLAGLTFYPILRVIDLSLHQYIVTGRSFVGLENYVNLLSNQVFLTSMITTFQFVSATVLVQFFLGFGIALVLNKGVRGRGTIQTILLIPLVTSATIIGLLWRLIYTGDGLLNYFLRGLGQQPVGWLSEPNIALYSIIIADIWQWTPFVVLVLFAGLQSVPDHLREAAIMDGASRRRRFFDITLPHLTSFIALVLIIRVGDALRIFAKVYILTRGGPSNATNVISMHIYRVAFLFGNTGEASAMAIALLAVIIVLIVLFIRIADVEF